MRRLLVIAGLLVIVATSAIAASLSVTSKGLSSATAIAFGPRAVALVLANSGAPSNARKPNDNDTVTVTYSKLLNLASMCNATDWTSDGSVSANDQVTITIKDNAAASGNDQLIVKAVTGCPSTTFKFGDVDLGTTKYVYNGDVDFKGTMSAASSIVWNGDSGNPKRTIVITLGGVVAGGGSVCTTGTTACMASGEASTSKYTPDPAIQDTGNRPILTNDEARPTTASQL